jgi:hypothetical protein
MRFAILAFAIALCLTPTIEAQQAAWTVGPDAHNPLDAIYRHADGDIDRDGRQDVSAFCSTTNFVIVDNTWPEVKGKTAAVLVVGDRRYEAGGMHLDPADTPYAVMMRMYHLTDQVALSWPAENAPNFTAGDTVGVVIGGQERDYGVGASAALSAVREQCIRNARGPPYN